MAGANIVQIEPDIDYMGNGENSGVVVQHCRFMEPLSNPPGEDTGDSHVVFGHNVSAYDSYFEKQLFVRGQSIVSGDGAKYGIINSVLEGSFQGGFSNAYFDTTNGSGLTEAFFIQAGETIAAGAGGESPNFAGVLLDSDTLIPGGTSATLTGINFIGTVQNEGTLINQGIVNQQIGAFVANNYFTWGSGESDTARGFWFYPQGSTGGATTLVPATMTLAIGGISASNACLTNPALATTTTSQCNKSIAAQSNLDTSLGTVVGCLGTGAAGFCNTAF